MMKLYCRIAAVALFVAFTALTAHAQAATAVPDSKVAVIDTDAFNDPKTGIKRLIVIFESVEREFKPRRDELTSLKTQYDQVVRDIEATKNVADQKVLTAKTDQAATLKNSIDRKAEDGQRDLEKRLRELTDPIYKDISTALQAYAKQRGITIILDASKLGEVMFVVNDAVDLTAGFIADYNQRNPSSAATPAKP